MKQLYTKLAMAGCMIIATSGLNAQCTGVTFTVTADTLACGGDSVYITAQPDGAVTVALGDDFNAGGVSPGWQVSPAGVFNNPCGPGPGGTSDPHMWMGNTTAAPRELITEQLDMSCGGQICFDFRMAIQGQSSPCEGPDAAGEGIYIEWSIDNGATYNTMNYFAPNTSGSFNSQSPGSGDYTGWANYCFTLPPAGYSDTTIFHWYQTGSSGTGYDHWGIDNVEVLANSCNAYIPDWDHIAGWPDTTAIGAYVTTDTSFTITFTDTIGLDTCTGTIPIYVDTTVNYTSNAVSPGCNNSPTGALNLTATSGDPTYTYNLIGGGSNSTGSFNNLTSGWYFFEISDSNNCFTYDSLEILPGPPMVLNPSGIDEICFGNSDGEISVGVPGIGNAPFNYDITGPSTGNNSSGDFSNLPPGMYYITVTDDDGCQGLDSIMIDTGLVLMTSNVADSTNCSYLNDGSIVITPGNGAGPYTYIINSPLYGDTSISGSFTNLPAGNYDITVIDGNGCIHTDNASIYSPPVVTADFTPSTNQGIIPITVNFNNSSSNATSYDWDFADGNTSTDVNPSHNYNTTGNFLVMLIASNNGCSDTAYASIYLADESILIVPNVFTANGDGINDQFEFTHENIIEFECNIFNRWGKHIHTMTNVTDKWDGKNKAGKFVADGTYFYTIKAVGLDNKEYNLNGTVNIFVDK